MPCVAPYGWWNSSCRLCKWAQNVATESAEANEHVARCTNQQIVGWMAGKTGFAVEWVAIRLDRDCKQYKRRRVVTKRTKRDRSMWEV